VSNALAIAAVTETLAALLWEASRTVRGAQVYHLRPDDAERLRGPAINLYLYKVIPNAAQRNRGLPFRDAGGALVQRPSAPFDLHYLLSFLGDEASLEPQRLMGAALQVMNDFPVLEPALIRAVVANAKRADPDTWMAGVDLYQQPDPVRVIPNPISTDTEARFFATFNKSTFALSYSVQVAAVVIEGARVPGAALPVRSAGARAVGAPVQIASVTSSFALGDTLTMVIAGQMPMQASIRLEGRLLTTAIVSATTLTATVDDSALAGLVPGPVTLSLLGGDDLPVASAPSSLLPTVRSVTISGAVAQVEIVPPPGLNQTVELLLNAPDASASYGIPPTEPSALTFSLAGVPSGTWLVRVAVDRTTSMLQWSEGGFEGPVLEVSNG